MALPSQYLFYFDIFDIFDFTQSYFKVEGSTASIIELIIGTCSRRKGEIFSSRGRSINVVVYLHSSSNLNANSTPCLFLQVALKLIKYSNSSTKLLETRTELTAAIARNVYASRPRSALGSKLQSLPSSCPFFLQPRQDIDMYPRNTRPNRNTT